MNTKVIIFIQKPEHQILKKIKFRNVTVFTVIFLNI